MLVLGLSLTTGDRVLRSVERADGHFERSAYRWAIADYLRAVELGARNEHVCRQLGRSYLMVGDAQAAEPWYRELVKYLERTPADVVAYGEVLRSLERYDEYEQLMCEHLCLDDPAGWARQQALLVEVRSLHSRSSNFKVENLELNTSNDEFAPAWHGNGHVLFSSNRPRNGGLPVVDGWTGAPFTCLYVADREPNGILTEPRLLPGVFDNWSNQGPACSTADGTLYYSGNGARRTSGPGTLEIHRADHKGGIHWKEAGNVVLTGWTQAAFHPALSHDGNTMVFGSDAPGGAGGTDLYITRWKDKAWTNPESVKGFVNTAGNELFPFLDSHGNLYFSSNGHPGMGGFDVFRAEADGDGGFGLPVNLGMPLNSGGDDLGFIVDRSGRNGYFASNRAGGKGGDDLYSFRLMGPMEPVPFLLAGTVRDQEGRPYRSGVMVLLANEHGIALDSVMSDTKGAFQFEMDPLHKLTLHARSGALQAPVQPVAAEPGMQRVVVRDLVLLDTTEPWVAGALVDARTFRPITHGEVALVNTDTYQSNAQQVGPHGEFRQRIQSGETYDLVCSATGYFTRVLTLGKQNDKAAMDAGLLQPLAMEPWVPEEALLLGQGQEVDAHDVMALAERLLLNPTAILHFVARTGVTEQVTLALVDHGVPAERIAFGQGQADTPTWYSLRKAPDVGTGEGQ